MGKESQKSPFKQCISPACRGSRTYVHSTPIWAQPPAPATAPVTIQIVSRPRLLPRAQCLSLIIPYFIKYCEQQPANTEKISDLIMLNPK